MKATTIKSDKFIEDLITSIIDLFKDNPDINEVTCNKGDDEVIPRTFFLKGDKLFCRSQVVDMKVEHEVTPDSFHRWDYIHYAKAIYSEMEDMKSYQYEDEQGHILNPDGTLKYEVYE